MEYQILATLKLFCLYDSFCVWENHLRIHLKKSDRKPPPRPTLNIQDILLLTLLIMQNLREVYMSFIMMEINNSSSPLILSIKNNLSSFSALMFFPNHFTFLLSLSLE